MILSRLGGALALFVATFLAVPVKADGVIDHVNGFTIDAANQLRRFHALVIRPDGTVGALLSGKDKLPKGLEWRYDAQGLSMIPGFVDAGARLIPYGLQVAGLDLSATASMADVQAALRAHEARHREARWLVGRGWNPALLTVTGGLTARQLDEVVADRPVFLLSHDGDAGWANSAALRLTGGEEGAGSASGILTGAALETMMRVVPEPLPAERDQALVEAQYRLLGIGVTTVTDVGTTERDWNSFRRASDSGRLRLRIASYADNLDGLLSIAGSRSMNWVAGGRLRMLGLRLGLDGSLPTSSAWLTKEGRGGLRRIGDTRLRNLASRVSMDGFQLLFVAHCDAAVEEALNVIDEMVPTYEGDRRWRIHGLDMVQAAHKPRLERAGIVTTARIGDNAYRPEAYAIGSGFTGVLQDPVAGLLTAQSPKALYQLDAAQALASFTSGPARAIFSESMIGRLLPGYQADFILLDGDPMVVPANSKPIRVIETWIGGRREWLRK